MRVHGRQGGEAPQPMTRVRGCPGARLCHAERVLGELLPGLAAVVGGRDVRRLPCRRALDVIRNGADSCVPGSHSGLGGAFHLHRNRRAARAARAGSGPAEHMSSKQCCAAAGRCVEPCVSPLKLGMTATASVVLPDTTAHNWALHCATISPERCIADDLCSD